MSSLLFTSVSTPRVMVATADSSNITPSTRRCFSASSFSIRLIVSFNSRTAPILTEILLIASSARSCAFFDISNEFFALAATSVANSSRLASSISVSFTRSSAAFNCSTAVDSASSRVKPSVSHHGAAFNPIFDAMTSLADSSLASFLRTFSSMTAALEFETVSSVGASSERAMASSTRFNLTMAASTPTLASITDFPHSSVEFIADNANSSSF
mmetsp:Transcript_7958/g.17941  ORF Transcript_7958/g.17941 Transcript_7958/m.17941 type:complete len:214 (-) Transcript_7958:596-1237(-)